ncbi:MAG: cation transporter [Alphaproteobacteria bacterium]|nr:cation transporter [Alphaproteobacteria bacterium]
MENFQHPHHHHGEVTQKSVKLLILSFAINMLLSVAEIIGGVVAGSISLIGDALHNTPKRFRQQLIELK